MQVDLSGRKALVIGGTRGVGRGITLALARSGADVLACYRAGGEHVDALARELKETPGEHHLVQADISDPGWVTALFDEVRTRFGRLDVVVNNAGVISHVPFAELSLAEWHRIVDTDLTGAFLAVPGAQPLLGEGASVVSVGSRVATVGIPLRSHYAGTGAGLPRTPVQMAHIKQILEAGG